MKKILSSLFLLPIFCLPLHAQNTEIFLKDIQGTEATGTFNVVDMDHDEDGNTYVLGQSSGNAVIVKYDSAGARSDFIEINNFVPVAMDVVGDLSNGYVFVASSKKVRRYRISDGFGFEVYNLGFGMFIKDISFASATDKLMVGLDGPGYPPIVLVLANSGTVFSEYVILEQAGSIGAALNSLTTDDLGNTHVVGRAAAATPAYTDGTWGPQGAEENPGGSQLFAGFAFVARINANVTRYDIRTQSGFFNLHEVTYANGWIYILGQFGGSSSILVQRWNTLYSDSLADVKGFIIENPGYAGLLGFPANYKKFSLTADDQDNVYITGFMTTGSAKFIELTYNSADQNFDSEEFTSVGVTSESAYIAKLDSDLKFEWVNTPIQSPIPDLGTDLQVSWDANNERIWWSGSYARNNSLSMQEGTDAGSRKTLPASPFAGNAGFVAVFEPGGEFTETAQFRLQSDFFTDNVTYSTDAADAVQIDQAGVVTIDLILNTIITVDTPRRIYLNGTNKTDDVTEPRDDVIIDGADTRYSFINFSVNNVVEDSNATSYTFSLTSPTAIRLEWLVEYSLVVDSNLANTASSARENDSSLYVEALTSKASGNPIPAVGKHWIERDAPVPMEIDGSVENLSLHPGLAVRFVPWRYRSTGSAPPDDDFTSVEPRQKLTEFTMSGPATVTYDWKLQYGVDIKTTNLSADPLMLVRFDGEPPTPTTPQSTSEGAGVHWYDQGTTLTIAAPQSLNLGDGPQALEGWLNGDNNIFSPTEDTFNTDTPDAPFSADQINAGFIQFDYDLEGPQDSLPFLGYRVVLNRPARVVWSYGDDVILKTVVVGDFLTFTPAEISNYGLTVDAEPTLDGNPEASDSSPSASDYIWDPVAKKLFPVRPTDFNLLWDTGSNGPARVLLTSIWGTIDYQHIADSPGVSLVSHPPDSEPDDLFFQEIAYAGSDAVVDEDLQFAASQAGRTVLRFSRVTPPGRGGVSESVVELRVVETKAWNTDLGTTEDAVIGRKITSSADLAGLDTGYMLFSKARYNPFVYARERFTGELLWDTANPPGPVIPVNQNPSASEERDDEFVVVWYDDPALNDYLLWPYKAVRYNPVWPTTLNGLGRILMSSRFGSESVAADGTDQEVVPGVTVDSTVFPAATTFDPARVEQVQIYNQPDKSAAGYNPNEEHALMAPSLRFASVAPRPSAAYALRENDLNVTAGDSSYTSDPFVLVQYLDKADNEFKMSVFSVSREDTTNYPNGFSQEMVAGEPVIPYYPLDRVSGATLCDATYAREGNPDRLTFWQDHKGTAWAVSGEGSFESYFFYPLLVDFWWPGGEKSPGECVAWLPDASTDLGRESFVEIDYTDPNQDPDAQPVSYTTTWPLDSPVLKVGETLTFSGGEYAADNPDAPGLPGLLAWAAGEVVFDQLNPDMREGAIDQDGNSFDRYTARIYSALEQRTVDLPVAQFPEALLPAGGRTEVDGTIYRFSDLSSSLKKRIFYNPLNGKLGIKGFINDKDIGDNTLTAAPPAVYVLEPNVLTEVEYKELNGSGDDSPFADLSGNSIWRNTVKDLYEKTRNPAGLSDTRAAANGGYTVGLEPQDTRDPASGDVTGQNADAAQAYKALGPGLALFANPGFLNPFDPGLPDVSYVTLAENNDPDLGGSPVILHILKVDRRERYRGAIKVVLSDNVFDENIILRHTGDFGAKADDLVFDWWYRVEDGTEALPPDQIAAGEPNPWKFFPDPSPNEAEGFFQLKLKGNPQAPELLLADSLWFVRYRHKNEVPLNPVTWESNPQIVFEWAGAGNSTPNDLDGDGVADYQAQLAQGWVKRVLDAVNPYEARIRDFTGEAPATYASMIRQFGQRFEGPVALNPDKNVIENVGLIELYATILKRARDLSIDLSTPVSTPGITNALLLASTRLADFYMLLGNEAYADALDPTMGHGSDSVEYGELNTTVFTFQNQLSTQIAEELALLRGVYDFKARPVYNRLFWNFTKGEGEAAYATNYNISDVTEDGFIDEDDAQVLFPQGHGDAWGHYLTAIRGQYELLNNPFFNWVSRSELYSLQDIVFEVDFLDERKFAQVAAAKAKTGAEIVELTHRDNYVEDPESQWQGYIDTNRIRAWGVEGWARRAGQGAYFDWVTANALIPSEHPNSSYEGIRKVDRSTVKDIAVVSANMNAIQLTYENANDGYNPLGISGNTVPFDIDPSALAGGNGKTHFEQMYERALAALMNARFLFDNANKSSNMLRKIENNEINFRRTVFEQDKGYRNRLIEIFGSPYDGTIGSGRAFPAGYSGPDTSLYMYVDQQVREITAQTVPGIATAFRDGLADIQEDFIGQFSSDVRGVTYSPSFSQDGPSDWLDAFGGVNYIVTEDDGITFDTSSARVGIANLELPIKSSGYTFEAPASWGQRSSPGKLQLHIASMIQKEAELAKAIAAWDGFQGEVVRQMQIMVAQQDTRDEVRKLVVGKIINHTVTGAAILAGKNAARFAGYFAEVTPDTVEAVGEFVPTDLPTAGFSFSPGDALSAVRGASYTAAQAAKGILQAVEGLADAAVEVIELTRDLTDMGLDLEISGLERRQGLKEALVELENMVGDEGILRVEIFRQQEALRQLSEQYRTELQKGARLLDAREAYNKRVAELVQRNRYQDMSFRVSRNSALQRYHEAFNLAARYTYLAAKAYDYETNLHPSDPGSAQGMFSDIVSARSIGFINRFVPYQGYGGLSDQLATMKANFDVLKGQLGLNNPQTETGRFSLRGELFRIAPTSDQNNPSVSDDAWKTELESARVDNLWDLPEFRRYCRPFAAYDPNVPEPGLVIEFSSEITSRKNFFGRMLAGGDNAYDPTNFSTKVFSVGVWFEDYLSDDFDTDLSETPRIYLVPVGTDVMLYPSDTELGARLWNVLDQKVPVPFPVSTSDLDNSNWRPLDTLGGTDGEIRKFSSFRAYHDSGYFDEGEMTFDSRLVGRSVWNTRWLLIIPGATLNADAEEGLQTFIDNISDIKLFFQTYGFSGN